MVAAPSRTQSDAVKADLILLTTSFFLLSASSLLSLPAGITDRLSADAFVERETAQADLLKWADKGGEGAVQQLLELWDDNEDPEIRERVQQVLRSLSDKDYQLEGKPYLGISMIEEIKNLDEKGDQMIGIVVTEILKGSPADSSKLRAGDMIVSLNGSGWKEGGAVNLFSDSIAKMKPFSEVVLEVERAGVEPFEVKVILRRCPVPNLVPGMGNLERLEAKAMEDFFGEWMTKKRSLEK